MDREQLVASLRTAVIELEGRLPGTDTQSVWELVEAGEPGVALENLCTQLYEFDVPVPQAVLERIAAAGEAMHLTPDLWIDLSVER